MNLDKAIQKTINYFDLIDTVNLQYYTFITQVVKRLNKKGADANLMAQRSSRSISDLLIVASDLNRKKPFHMAVNIGNVELYEDEATDIGTGVSINIGKLFNMLRANIAVAVEEWVTDTVVEIGNKLHVELYRNGIIGKNLNLNVKVNGAKKYSLNKLNDLVTELNSRNPREYYINAVLDDLTEAKIMFLLDNGNVIAIYPFEGKIRDLTAKKQFDTDAKGTAAFIKYATQ